MNDTPKITGRLSWSLVDADGNIIDKQEGPNLVVAAGTAFLADLLAGNSPNLMTHMAVGTNGAAPDSGQTTLLSEVGRVAVSSTTASMNNTTYTATFPPGTGTGTLAEAGLFNDNTVGTMLSRSVSINVVKGAGDTLNIVWTITFNP